MTNISAADFPRDPAKFKRWRERKNFAGEIADLAKQVGHDLEFRKQADAQGTPIGTVRSSMDDREAQLVEMLRAQTEKAAGSL